MDQADIDKMYAESETISALKLVVDSPFATSAVFTVAYLTSGFSWTPSYSLLIRPDQPSESASNAHLVATARLSHSLSSSVSAELIQLVGGKVETISPSMARGGYAMKNMAMSSMAMDSAESVGMGGATHEATSDLHVYSYARPDHDPISLLPSQERRVPFIPATDVAVSKLYTQTFSAGYQSDSLNVHPRRAFKWDNVDAHKEVAGPSLIPGTVHVYSQKDETLLFLGSTTMPSTASAAEAVLHLGEGSDITCSKTVTEYSGDSSRRTDEIVHIVCTVPPPATMGGMELGTSLDEELRVEIAPSYGTLESYKVKEGMTPTKVGNQLSWTVDLGRASTLHLESLGMEAGLEALLQPVVVLDTTVRMVINRPRY
ncbi:hypothetical protein KIPB_006296 [Kipferlia bialata]|uniref:Uncharacterized protein n=1 Tax=Kipferlia bialata TaxID=797122 RepID=A0A9K3CZD7_9EUKA|nr:hypothetical protein KIPB_006296 [Kipferlia bialata]|eukprot:g6296.t1